MSSQELNRVMADPNGAVDRIEELENELEKALGIIHDLLGLELGSADKAMAFLDSHSPTADEVRGILSAGQ